MKYLAYGGPYDGRWLTAPPGIHEGRILNLMHWKSLGDSEQVSYTARRKATGEWEFHYLGIASDIRSNLDHELPIIEYDIEVVHAQPGSIDVFPGKMTFDQLADYGAVDRIMKEVGVKSNE